MSDKQVKWQHGQTVMCTFQPRSSFRGRSLRADLLTHLGARLILKTLWRQTDDDPYPGEWALGSLDSRLVFGRTWISSGDVKVRETAHDQGIHTGPDLRPCPTNESCNVVYNSSTSTATFVPRGLPDNVNRICTHVTCLTHSREWWEIQRGRDLSYEEMK